MKNSNIGRPETGCTAVSATPPSSESSKTDISGYCFNDADCQPASILLMPHLLDILSKAQAVSPHPLKVFDLGCGNGAAANAVATAGYNVAGVDPSTSGIEKANQSYPKLDLRIGSAYDDLQAAFGSFDVVYSFEVVEHLYDPHAFATCLFNLIKPGGKVLISTPYHGYLKNLALAISGKLDQHFTALWIHGHIKFWSIRTLTELLSNTGFSVQKVVRVGRIPPLAKSMLAIAERPLPS